MLKSKKIIILLFLLFIQTIYAADENGFSLSADSQITGLLGYKNNLITMNEYLTFDLEAYKIDWVFKFGIDDLNFNKISYINFEINWDFEFYLLDIHPFIATGIGYLYLNDDNLINKFAYLKFESGVLYHLYHFWNKLKVGSSFSTIFYGFNDNFGVGIFVKLLFIEVEF